MGSRKPQNPDLQEERKKCTFNPLELTSLLDGGREKTKERKFIEDYFFSDQEFIDSVPIDFLSHKEQYEQTVRKACIAYRKLQELQNSKDGFDEHRGRVIESVISAILKDGNLFTINTVMFASAINGQGTPEQRKMWLQRALKHNILGTYAQTELGHGTFVRGLETTAHYDPKTKEFILNSPTVTSYKWWPGALGHTVNYAIVVAQLYTQGVIRGVHLFIVQLRNEETHEPLPGIEIGEIGKKLGMNTMNNGFLALKNVRIPREHMLMKNSKVLEDGSYVKSKNEKLAYGTLMFVRVVMLQTATSDLAKACTIAIRYSAVRRQSELKRGGQEAQILDYRTQQYKLFPYLATSFAVRYAAVWLWNMYKDVVSEIEMVNLERLPELHALSCCLKALCTTEAAQGVEMCRLSCGGHGYMTCSNFPTLYGNASAACTYEGENTVMLLQTARYLMKAWQQAVQGKDLPPTVAYLKRAVSGSDGVQYWENSIESIVIAFQQVVASKIKHCADTMGKRIQEGCSPEDAWNMTSIQLVQCAEAHARVFLVDTFVRSVGQLNASVALKTVMTQLSDLYVIYNLLKNAGDFFMYTNVTSLDLSILQNQMETLLSQLRPNAVGIVDGFDFHDQRLSSTLGAWDGQVYERLFEAASMSPLNKDPVNESFHKHLRPFLKSSL